MLVLTREDEFVDKYNRRVYPSNTYPYQETSNTFGPLQYYDNALLDACLKRISTQKGSEEAYSDAYGMDWVEIHSQPEGWIRSNVTRMITECLSYDDRVKTVDAEIAEIKKDYIHIKVTINNTNTGEIIV